MVQEEQEKQENLFPKERLDILEGKIFTFEWEDHHEQVIKVGSYLHSYKSSYLTSDSIKFMLSHPKINEFFDQLELDWIYKSFAYPELILNNSLFSEVVNENILDPLDLVLLFLKQTDLHTIVTAKLFYEKVFCNRQINTKEKLRAVCNIIRVAKDISDVLDNIDEPMNRVLHNNNYGKIFRKYLNTDLKIDMTWSEIRLKEEWHNIKINYIGNLSLPDHCKLINTWQDLKENYSFKRYNLRPSKQNSEKDEFFNIYHLENYWSKMVEKKSFAILMEEKPEQIIFFISNCGNTKWFVLEDTSILKNTQASCSALEIMSRSIVIEQNQLFFKENFHKERIDKRFLFDNEIAYLLEYL